MSEREDRVLPPDHGGQDGGKDVGAPGAPREIDHDAPGSDPIAELVRLAGARPAVPRERALRVEAAVREAWAEAAGVRRRRRVAGWTAGAALAAALVLALGLGFWQRAAPPAPDVATVERVSGSAELGPEREAGAPLIVGAAVAAGATVATADDGRVALRLLDGPSLRLDVDTRLTLVAADRVRLTSGAVYVDSQGGRPVTVETPWGEVEERGTQFEVRLLQARLPGEAVRVRVREGAVELAADDRSWQAGAGGELLLTAGGELTRGVVPFHGHPWQWVQEIAPTFEIEGRTLGEFLAWVGRETGWQVRWRESAAERQALANVLHGSVEGLPPEQALAAVLPTCGLAHRIDDGTVVVFAN